MQEIKLQMAHSIAAAIKTINPLNDKTADDIVNMLEYPPKAELGDFAFPCFKMAKELQMPPKIIAEKICENIPRDSLEKVEPAGGYINFKVKDNLVFPSVVGRILREKNQYGSSSEGAGKVVTIDFSSPNIAKPFHIAHLISTVMGNAIRNIYEFLGYDCVAINYIGDWGTQFGKVIVAYMKWCGDMSEIERSGVYKLTELYVKFTAEAEEDPSLLDEARMWFAKLERRDPEAYGLWEKFRSISLEEFNRAYEMIGIKFDSFDGESFFNDKMDAVITELREKDLLKIDDGASIVELEEYNMPPCLILKRDGATLYPTRDIASAIYRKKTYNFYKNLYLADTRQALHFSQWMKVMELMGHSYAEDCVYIPFGLMSVNGESLGTRKGNMLLLDDIFKMSIEKVRGIIEEKNPNQSEERKAAIAKAVGIGAIIFNDLKNSRVKNFNFSWDEALNFDGNSGPYLQYTYARACTVIDKSGCSEQNINIDVADDLSLNPSEHELVLTLALFPEKVKSAAADYEPSIISRYLLDLCAVYNKFYNECPIIRAESDIIRRMRVALCIAVKYTLGNGLSIIGLEKTETM